MNKHRLLFLSAAAVAAVTLSACGGGDAPGASSPSAAPTQSTSAAPTSAAPTSSAPTSSAPATAAPATSSEAAPSSSSASPSAAPTSAAPSSSAAAAPAASYPAGSKMKAVDLKSLPATAGEWKRTDDGSAPAAIYSNASGDMASVSKPLDSKLDALAASIETDKKAVGTGFCGIGSGGVSQLCYLDSASGVINISADASDVKRADFEAFVVALTDAVGVAK